MPTPIVGLSTYRESADWGVWKQSADLLPSQYARSIYSAGGLPVLLPPAEDRVIESAVAAVSRLDGLLIAGGADVAPDRYGDEPHPQTSQWRHDRDAWELALLDAAFASGVPTLGICRGMQLMAVHSGGRLNQHVPDLVGHHDHSPGGDTYGATAVTAVSGSRIAGLIGAANTVACHHHQSVAEHPSFVPSAHAYDGTLEAMESSDASWFCLAVQWHPETSADIGLFAGLVDAAATFASRERSK